MPPYELTTLMRREAPGYTGPPNSYIPLPPEIKIHTSFNLWLRDGLWGTLVTCINSDGKPSLVCSYASLESADKQHNAIVGIYKEKGYKVVEHIKPLTNVQLGALETLLEGVPGLDQF